MTKMGNSRQARASHCQDLSYMGRIQIRTLLKPSKQQLSESISEVGALFERNRRKGDEDEALCLQSWTPRFGTGQSQARADTRYSTSSSAINGSNTALLKVK